ncbi:MAG: hypothetical protein SRB2_01842 [Desulfobacteraceae bacterium Eth-SRB2]|nr:MAG: hypothetical protein SRB2_01842 [Desulfobacteraceae bacterium Eth-SRB2]
MNPNNFKVFMPFRKNSRYRVERIEIRFQGLEPPGRFKVVARVPVSDIHKNRFIQGFGQTRFIINLNTFVQNVQ